MVRSAVLVASITIVTAFDLGLRNTGSMASTSDQIWAEPFHLADVRLIPANGSSPFDFKAAQDLNLHYLKYLDADRLLFTFRTIAGLDPKGPGGNATPYGGWITPYNDRMELVNGHFTGHLLSALAFAAASTDDVDIIDKSNYLVAQLAKCQDAYCANHPSDCGYLSAYYLWQIERVENHTGPTWATYYTIHKIMSGLIDQYLNIGNGQALGIVTKMASYFKGRIDRVIAEKGWSWWQQCLRVEFGGMNEVGYNLYAITGDPEHKAIGDLFYKEVFMNPLAVGNDSLSNQHANTHIPEIVGMARGWEVTGNATQRFLTYYFYQLLSEHYTYSATGGSNVGEMWRYRDNLGDAIATVFDASGHVIDSNGFHTEETCTQYNVLKVVRHLFKWSPKAHLADDYEHKLLNGLMGVQQPGTVGKMLYMTPLGRGVSRPRANWGEGFGSPNHSFWCCYGTGVESFAKLGDSIYFRSDATQEMWISQFISSTVRWNSSGLKIAQQAVFSEDGRSLVVDITVQQAKPTIHYAELTIPGGGSCRVASGKKPHRICIQAIDSSQCQNQCTFQEGCQQYEWRADHGCCLHGKNISMPAATWIERAGEVGPVVKTNGDGLWRCYTKQEDTEVSLASAPTIHIRIPEWASQTSTSIRVNDQDVVKPGDAMTGSFLGVKRYFVVGDVIHASFGMRPRFERINDNRSEYANVGSIHFGPLTLAGLTSQSFALRADPARIDSWLTVKGPLRFHALGVENTTFELLPLNRVVNESYTAYFNVSLDATDGNDLQHAEPFIAFKWDGTYI